MAQTADRDGTPVEVGDDVRFRLSDSARDHEGRVTEILPSGGMYVVKPNGYAELTYPECVTKVGA
jgi:hypothetical protein